MAKLADAKRILVVTKFKYLGDTIVATPFLRRLEEALPQAQITLLAGPAIPDLLRGCPYITDLWPFDPKTDGGWAGNRKLICQIQEAGFDAAFLINRSIHSAVLAALARIPIRIGHDTEHRGFLLTDRVSYDWNKPDRLCALDLLEQIGLKAEPALPELWVSEDESADAKLLLESKSIVPGSFIVGIQPGANDPEIRQWGAAKFASLADRLTQERRAAVILFGSRDERGESGRVAAAMETKPLILTGETNLRQAMALISMCDLWIGNDGGLLHAAVALGPATVGIFGPTKAPRWGYDEPRHKTVVVYPVKPSKDPRIIRNCLGSIDPEAVFQAAMSVMPVIPVRSE